MQKQINIQPQLTLKQIQVLIIQKLRIEQIIHGDLRARTRDLNTAFAALDEEDADFVAGDGEVDFVPFAFWVGFPGDENAFVAEGARGVLEGAEFWFAA